MINLLKYKYIFFAISLLVILPGLYFLGRYGLRLSIDFTGGSLIEIKNEQLVKGKNVEEMKKIFQKNGVEVALVQRTGNNTYLFRSKSINSVQKDKIIFEGQSKFGPIEQARFDTVGPVIGAELTQKAIQAVIAASIAIVFYIAFSFREVPKPYSPWKFGIAAVIALVHDVFVVVGVFAILGHFLDVEIDALFVTALLTVIGFSVHDTIVVFDRVRENLRRVGVSQDFESIVNESLVQTLGRSLNTSITVLLVLLSLILFGGESIRWFVVALFVGVLSGTYSSIFNAAPLLVLWEERKK